MTDPIPRLNAALEGRYRVEREGVVSNSIDIPPVQRSKTVQTPVPSQLGKL